MSLQTALSLKVGEQSLLKMKWEAKEQAEAWTCFKKIAVLIFWMLVLIFWNLKFPSSLAELEVTSGVDFHLIFPASKL